MENFWKNICRTFKFCRFSRKLSIAPNFLPNKCRNSFVREKINYFEKIFAETKKVLWLLRQFSCKQLTYFCKRISQKRKFANLCQSRWLFAKLEKAIFFSSQLRWVVCYCRTWEDLSDRLWLTDKKMVRRAWVGKKNSSQILDRQADWQLTDGQESI